jgi:hypothetical protein
MKVDPEPPPDSTDIANLTSYLRQIADELDYEAKCPPCSEAEIIRLAATEIERLRRDVAEMGVLVTRAIDNFLIDRVFQRIAMLWLGGCHAMTLLSFFLREQFC